MTKSTREIRQACRYPLQAVSELTGIPFMYENREFDPPSSGLWCRETLILSVEQRLSSCTFLQGFYQLDTFYPAGKGTETPEDLVAAIKLAYPADSSIVDPLTSVDLSIYRTQSLSGAVIPGEAWYMIPLRVFWQTTRP